MQKTPIEWVKNPDGTQGYTSNPIRGLCPMACKLPDGRVYCYEARRRQRFKIPIHFEFHQKELRKIEWARDSRGIFLGSTIELFHKAIPYDWRRAVFKTIRACCPQHRFYVLTKLPHLIDWSMPENVWLGTSITKNEDIWRRNRLVLSNAKIKFISFEPLLENLDFTLYQGIDWIIIGRLTQYGHKYDPKLRWIKKIVRNCADYGIKVFLKDNLKEIWGEPLIQEFPKIEDE